MSEERTIDELIDRICGECLAYAKCSCAGVYDESDPCSAALDELARRAKEADTLRAELSILRCAWELAYAASAHDRSFPEAMATARNDAKEDAL
jgi:hypothetical protein